MTHDPSATASYKVGLFGLPTTAKNSQVVIIPVPWEVTTSYGAGTSQGPLTIWKASPQIDLFDLELGQAFEAGYHLLPLPTNIAQLNDELKPKAMAVREQLEETQVLDQSGKSFLQEVNDGCRKMTAWVHEQAQALLAEGKIPAVLGGDHSSPEGNIRAICEHYAGDVGVLHFDAHADLREAYQGFERSHASIMNNVMTAEWKPRQLVQVGIRDFCQEEYELIQRRADIHTFFDIEMKRDLFQGQTWAAVCARLISQLPEKVYVSFDIDGLSPEFCPNTGTPVPGGLSFDQANFLLRQVVESGRRIVGFDLNEVAPDPDGADEWDGNVGARLLYKLCGWAVVSQKNKKPE